MSETIIEIQIGAEETVSSDCVILVPEKALLEAGFIRNFSFQAGANAKHVFHAMTQMAYYQYQDGELEIAEQHEKVRVAQGDKCDFLEDGMILFRDLTGGFHVRCFNKVMNKKLIETAYRFSTRWVRLDI